MTFRIRWFFRLRGIVAAEDSGHTGRFFTRESVRHEFNGIASGSRPAFASDQYAANPAIKL